MINVSVQVDLKGVEKKIKEKLERAQAVLDEQVIKDSNYYAPQDESILINSSLTASKIGEGVLIWDTPYARRLYWNPEYNFSTDMNENAGGKWFEVAKSKHLSDWLKMTQSEVNK